MTKPKPPKGAKKDPERAASELTHFCSPATDPEGCYTGRPADPFDYPTQDADDL